MPTIRITSTIDGETLGRNLRDFDGGKLPPMLYRAVHRDEPKIGRVQLRQRSPRGAKRKRKYRYF